jgi:hypothetical protein
MLIRYPQLFWLHLGFILLFWKEDNSPAFENTDAAVEKSVNLAFDLIGNSLLKTLAFNVQYPVSNTCPSTELHKKNPVSFHLLNNIIISTLVSFISFFKLSMLCALSGKDTFNFHWSRSR